MESPVIRAIYFVLIILLGHVLRRIGLFKKEDFKVLSNIVLKLTLPAAIIVNFAGKSLDLSMLALIALGLGGGILYMILGYLTEKSFGVLNLSGYNVGNFALPFIQSIFGPIGVITASFFDVGNAFVSLGGAYSIASSLQGNNRFSFRKILKTMATSVPFVCYVLMIILNFTKVNLPSQVISFVKIIADANVLVGMLMLGIGFEVTANRKQIGKIAKFLGMRYGVAIVLALCAYCFLPFAKEIKITLLFLLFSPIASAAPAYTGQMGEDAGLASAINSFSVVCSVLIFVVLLLIL